MGRLLWHPTQRIGWSIEADNWKICLLTFSRQNGVRSGIATGPPTLSPICKGSVVLDLPVTTVVCHAINGVNLPVDN